MSSLKHVMRRRYRSRTAKAVFLKSSRTRAAEHFLDAHHEGFDEIIVRLAGQPPLPVAYVIWIL